jgi:hypothetical protein
LTLHHEPNFLQRHPHELPPGSAEPGGIATMERGKPSFGWDGLVPRVVHPLRVAIVEALWWVDLPLSATDFTKLIDDEEFGLSCIAYHVKRLAETGVIRVVRRRPVRGSVEKFYSFTPPPTPPSA